MKDLISEMRKRKNENRCAGSGLPRRPQFAARLPFFVFRFSFFAFLSVSICVHLCSSPPALAQEGLQEIVATQAAGRAIVYVARDGIVVATEGAAVEPGSRPPLIAPLSRSRVVVLFGAVEWLQPGTGRPVVRLDREMVKLTGGPSGPRLTEEEVSNDIEALGVNFLEKLRETVSLVHGELPLGPEDSLVEMLIVGYAPDYGPEVWRVRYHIVQDFLRDGFYRTRVLRPAYEQLYPPEKGRAKTMVEVRFPAAAEPPELLDLVRRDDSMILRMRGASLEIARAVERLKKDDMVKTVTSDAVAFVRAAVEASAQAAPAGTPREPAPVSLLVIREIRYEWVIEPAERPELAAEEPAKPRTPGAPTLKRPRPPQ